MSLLSMALSAAENGQLPDAAIRAGIRRLLRQRLRKQSAGTCEEQQARLQSLVEELRHSPVALVPEKANEQHYEWPAPFFQLCLGEHRKYSCCYWPDGVDTLDEAESAALELTCQRAELADGQRILELGCGWGSLSLWMARHFPNGRITAVSNSNSQRQFIENQARAAGLDNLHVVTADMNDFRTDDQFDRVVSVEMFEHMRNYQQLLRRISSWLSPDGLLFVHIFCHREFAYPFEEDGDANWMGRLFFSGGLMPSDNLLARFQDNLSLEHHWRLSGRHYERTSNAWLQKFDAQREPVERLLRQSLPAEDVRRWIGRWRIFFMSCAELFGFEGGQQWWVSHYLFRQGSQQRHQASSATSAEQPAAAPHTSKDSSERERPRQPA